MSFRKHVSAGKIKRGWRIYSPSTGNIYCFPWALFDEAQNRSQFKTGFSDWKNEPERIKQYEHSAIHRVCVQTRIRRRRIHKPIDSSVNQFNKEREYWVKLLLDVVLVIKFLSSHRIFSFGQILYWRQRKTNCNIVNLPWIMSYEFKRQCRCQVNVNFVAVV